MNDVVDTALTSAVTAVLLSLAVQKGARDSVCEKLIVQAVVTPLPTLIPPSVSVEPAMIVGLVPHVPAVGAGPPTRK